VRNKRTEQTSYLRRSLRSDGHTTFQLPRLPRQSIFASQNHFGAAQKRPVFRCSLSLCDNYSQAQSPTMVTYNSGRVALKHYPPFAERNSTNMAEFRWAKLCHYGRVSLSETRSLLPTTMAWLCDWVSLSELPPFAERNPVILTNNSDQQYWPRACDTGFDDPLYVHAWIRKSKDSGLFYFWSQQGLG